MTEIREWICKRTEAECTGQRSLDRPEGHPGNRRRRYRGDRRSLYYGYGRGGSVYLTPPDVLMIRNQPNVRGASEDWTLLYWVYIRYLCTILVCLYDFNIKENSITAVFLVKGSHTRFASSFDPHRLL